MKDLNDFWASRALSGASRWTSREMLDYELSFLRNLIPKTQAGILDLGCGDALLSRTLASERGLPLVAVDSTPEFDRFFVDEQDSTFLVQSVSEFTSTEKFSLVLMFGVANFLDEGEELALHSRISRWLETNAYFVLKHQCSLGDAFTIDAFSEDLGTHYRARYPSVARQLMLLGQIFDTILVRPYPESFRTHDNSHHFAFLCSSSCG